MIETVVDAVQSSLFMQGAIIPKKGVVGPSEMCDGCGVISSKKMRPIDLDGEPFKLCNRCREKTKKYILKGCP